MTVNNIKDKLLNRWVSFNLKIGLVLSLSLIIIGLILLMISDYDEAVPALSLNQLTQEILRLNPVAIIMLGIIFLLLTPISQIITAAINFVRIRDKKFCYISLILLLFLLLSFIIALIEI